MGIKVSQNHTPGPGEGEPCYIDQPSTQPVVTTPPDAQPKSPLLKNVYAETKPLEKPSADLAQMALSGLKKAANFFGLSPYIDAATAQTAEAKNETQPIILNSAKAGPALAYEPDTGLVRDLVTGEYLTKDQIKDIAPQMQEAAFSGDGLVQAWAAEVHQARKNPDNPKIGAKEYDIVGKQLLTGPLSSQALGLEPEMAPEQYLTVASVILNDLEVQIYALPPGIALDVLLSRRNDLVNQSGLEWQKLESGNPLNGKIFYNEVQKLKKQVADFETLGGLSRKTLNIPSRFNKDGVSPSSLQSKEPLVISNLKTEMEEALLNGNDTAYAKAAHKLEVLGKYTAHLEMKQQLATLLREAAPLPIKHFIAPFNLDYKIECAPLKPGDELYAVSEIPCGVIDDSTFFKTYKELKEKNPAAAKKFEEGFYAVYGNESILVLDDKALDSDEAYKKLEVSIEAEDKKMQSAGFEEFFTQVAAKEKQGHDEVSDPAVAKRREMIMAHIAGLNDDKELSQLFDDLLYPTLVANDENKAAQEISENLIATTQALITEASNFRYTEKSDLENERINLAYQTMTAHVAGDSNKIESVELGDPIEIGNAHDYVGATDAPDAPDLGKFHENGLAYLKMHDLEQLQEQLKEIQTSTTLSPKDKFAEMWKVMPQIRAARLDFLKMRLAEEMGGLDISVQNKEPIKKAMDQIAMMDEKTDPETFSQVHAEVIEGLQKEIEKEALKKSIDDFDKVIAEVIKNDAEMKAEVEEGIYGINDGMRTGIFSDEMSKLSEARALLQSGRFEEARAKFLSVMDAGKHKALLARFGLHEEGKQIVKDFAKNVAIT
ncbi:MAG: hypothetical protein ACD_73C00169G0001, partial [uncultured bacterium]